MYQSDCVLMVSIWLFWKRFCSTLELERHLAGLCLKIVIFLQIGEQSTYAPISFKPHHCGSLWAVVLLDSQQLMQLIARKPSDFLLISQFLRPLHVFFCLKRIGFPNQVKAL